MNEASQARHERVETLLDRVPLPDPKHVHVWRVHHALLILLEESVVQAQRLEMLENLLATLAETSYQTDFRLTERIRALEGAV